MIQHHGEEKILWLVLARQPEHDLHVGERTGVPGNRKRRRRHLGSTRTATAATLIAHVRHGARVFSCKSTSKTDLSVQNAKGKLYSAWVTLYLPQINFAVSARQYSSALFCAIRSQPSTTVAAGEH